MNPTKGFREMKKEDLLIALEQIDVALSKAHTPCEVTLVGGAAIVLQNFRERATHDLDIAATKDASTFVACCQKVGLPVDVISMASTVDFQEAPKVTLSRGKALTVHAVTARDLVKLKLERFYKQDPEDIYAIIEKTSLAYEDFKSLVKEMTSYFVGDQRKLILSAGVVVETKFPTFAESFHRELRS